MGIEYKCGKGYECREPPAVTVPMELFVGFGRLAYEEYCNLARETIGCEKCKYHTSHASQDVYGRLCSRQYFLEKETECYYEAVRRKSK